MTPLAILRAYDAGEVTSRQLVDAPGDIEFHVLRPSADGQRVYQYPTYLGALAAALEASAATGEPVTMCRVWYPARAERPGVYRVVWRREVYAETGEITYNDNGEE